MCGWQAAVAAGHALLHLLNTDVASKSEPSSQQGDDLLPAAHINAQPLLFAESEHPDATHQDTPWAEAPLANVGVSGVAAVDGVCLTGEAEERFWCELASLAWCPVRLTPPEEGLPWPHLTATAASLAPPNLVRPTVQPT